MKRLVVCIFACLVVLSLPAAAEKKVALVIGNSQYRHAKPLPNPDRDAKAMAKMLESIGFSVVAGTDLDRQAMAGKIREFAAKAQSADTVLYFYAGHGIQLDGQNYLIPVDADLNNEMDVKLSTLDIDMMLQQTPATARVKLVLLDACRDNPFKEQIARSLSRTRSAALGNGLAEMKPSFGTLIAYATGPGETALDGDSANSPFTTALLKYLPQQGLEIGQAMTRVRGAVYEDTGNRQLPWENKNLTSDYYLVPSVAIAPAQIAASIAPEPLVPPKQETAQKSLTEENGEIVLWQAVKDSTDPAEIQAYLDRYGDDGIFAAAARKRIAALAAKPAEEAAPAVTEEPAAKPPAVVKKPAKIVAPKPVVRTLAPKTEPKPVWKKPAKKKVAPEVVAKPVKTAKKIAVADQPPRKKRRRPGNSPSIGIGIGTGSGFGISFGF